MIDMDPYDEPDPDSDLDYEETYSKRNKRRKGTGRVSNTVKWDIPIDSSLFKCLGTG